MQSILIALTGSILVFLMAVIVMVSLSRNVTKLRKRVDDLKEKDAFSNDTVIRKSHKDDAGTTIFGNFSKGKAAKKLGDELAAAAVPLKVDEFVMLWLLAALGPAALSALINFNILVCIALIGAGTVIVPVMLGNAKRKRMTLFDKQLSDALSIIGNSIKAGFSFQQAMEGIAAEMPEPISKEFQKTLREIKLGMTMEQALTNMVERIDNGDLELVVSSILIQRQVGGNLSEILDTISQTIRERIKLKNDIRVLTASAKTSGTIVGMLPVFIIGILMLINPTYVMVFFNTPTGMAMLIGSALLEIIGFSIIRKIVDVKF